MYQSAIPNTTTLQILPSIQEATQRGPNGLQQGGIKHATGVSCDRLQHVIAGEHRPKVATIKAIAVWRQGRRNWHGLTVQVAMHERSPNTGTPYPLLRPSGKRQHAAFSLNLLYSWALQPTSSVGEQPCCTLLDNWDWQALMLPCKRGCKACMLSGPTGSLHMCD